VQSVRQAPSPQRPRRCPRLILFAACALLLPAIARAQEHRALLDLIVNESPKGEVLVLLRGADVWVNVETIERAGLRRLAGERLRVDLIEYVSLLSLSPGVSFSLDERALTLRIAARPELFERTVVALRSAAPANLEYRRDTSAFLNYAATFRSGGGRDLVAESGLSIRGLLITNSLSRLSSGRLVRGLSTATLDDRRRLLRWSIGDMFSTTGVLGGGLLLSGIAVSRDYGLDPYFVRFPSVGLSAAAATPSTVEVYVNDQLVRREQVPVGPFELADIPAPGGAGEARVVVRDVFGREQVIATPFYVSASALADGLHEFGYTLGYPRRNAGVANWDHGRLAFMARHRYGLTDHLTAGVRIEATSGLFNVGPLVTGRTRLGEIEIAAATSRRAGVRGAAGSLAYAYVSRSISVGAAVTSLSPSYSTLSPEASDRVRLSADGFASLPLGGAATLTLQQGFADRYGGPSQTRTAVTAYTRLTGRSSLSLSARRLASPTTGISGEFFAGLGVLFGERTTASLSYDRSREGGAASAEIQRALPAGVGVGYRANWRTTDAQQGHALLQYHGPFGRYELQQDVRGGVPSTSVTLSGGIAAIGGGVHLTRPIQESFALVKVPGVGGVRSYVSNQPIGRTSRRGNLLVPNLLPYYGNPLSIDDQDVPLTYQISGTRRLIAPPYRGGALVIFDVSKVQGVSGRVAIRSNGVEVVPAFGQISVMAADTGYESPIGSEGQFYLENLPAGRHPATITYRDRTCRFTIVMPRSDEAAVSLGSLTCTIR
jgi:outer membrane usher protein